MFVVRVKVKLSARAVERQWDEEKSKSQPASSNRTPRVQDACRRELMTAAGLRSTTHSRLL